MRKSGLGGVTDVHSCEMVSCIYLWCHLYTPDSEEAEAHKELLSYFSLYMHITKSHSLSSVIVGFVCHLG
jgi:hypothetical protein